MKLIRAPLRIAVCLRVFQHLAEIFPPLLTVWREEHPLAILPRNRSDWQVEGPISAVAKLGNWVWNALWTWAKCLLVFAFRIVPAVDDEVRRCYVKLREAPR
ncbi:MAG TPA: hypothetical protein VN231_02940 [Allosphingosinicella sp.]|nr:hypothetical protein [Allosphingosinicella sp.]